MTISTRAARAFLLAGTAVLSFGAAQAAPSAEVFGALPAMRFPAISPDGKHLAALEPVNGKSTIVVFDLTTPTNQPIAFEASDGVPANITWASDDRVVGTFSTEKIQGESTGAHLRGAVRSVSMSVSGGKPFVLMQGTRPYTITNGNAEFLGIDPGNPGSVLMAAYDISGERVSDTKMKQSYYNYNLYSVDTEKGDMHAVERGTEKTQQWVVDGKGQAIAHLESGNDLSGDLYIRDAGAWRKALKIDELAGFDAYPVGVTADGSALLMERDSVAETSRLDSFPVNGTSFGQTLYSNPTYDIENEISDPWSGQIVGVSYIDNVERFSYFQPDLDRWQRSLEKTFPGETVELVSWDKARDAIIVATESPKEPRIYNIFKPATGQFTAIASQYPTLQASELGDMKPYPYSSSDGLKINAYLTLPPGKTPKNLPTIIFPHGGPEDRDQLSFDWWAQFMATRGYAVLQPNFRGSSGYGNSFRSAGFGQWGKKMQDDISDGVRKLIADGVADPKRICIVGASYGGYAALAGATFTPDLYACSVSFAGIGDLASLIGNTANNHGSESPAVAYWESRIGSRYKDAALLAEISPALHADKVRAPVLLIHCNNDLTVPIAQSEVEQAALQKAGKKVEFITIDGDDHYLKSAATRVRVLQEIDKFLAANIGN